MAILVMIDSTKNTDRPNQTALIAGLIAAIILGELLWAVLLT